MHVRVNSDDEDGKVEEVVIVKTDIKAPKATAFAKVDGQKLNLSTNTENDGEDNTIDDDTLEALMVVAAVGDDVDANLPKIKSLSANLTETPAPLGITVGRWR